MKPLPARLLPAVILGAFMFLGIPCGSARAEEPNPVIVQIGEAAAAPSADADPIIRISVVGEVPRRPASLVPSYLSLSALSATDAYMTLWATRRGAIEANPAMKYAVKNPFALIGVKAVTTAATILLTEQVWADHPRRAVWTMIGINVANGLIVWHNGQVIAGLRRTP